MSMTFASLTKNKPYSGKGKRKGTPGHYTYDYDEPKGRDKKEHRGAARIHAANTAAIDYFNAEKDSSVDAVEDMTELAYAPDAYPKMKALEGWTKAMGLKVFGTGVSATSAYVTIEAPGEDLFSDVKVRFSDHGNMGRGHAVSGKADVNIAQGTARDFVTGIWEALDTLLDRLEMDEEDEPGYEAAVAHISDVQAALVQVKRGELAKLEHARPIEGAHIHPRVLSAQLEIHAARIWGLQSNLEKMAVAKGLPMTFSDIIKARGGGYSGKGKRTGSPGHFKYDYDEPKGQIGFSGVVVEAKKPKKRRSDAQRQLSMFGEAEAPHIPGAAAPKHTGRAKPAAPGQASIFDAPKDTKTIDVEEAIAEKKAPKAKLTWRSEKARDMNMHRDPSEPIAALMDATSLSELKALIAADPRLALDEVRSAGRKHIARVVIDDDQMGEISIEEAIAEKKAPKAKLTWRSEKARDMNMHRDPSEPIAALMDATSLSELKALIAADPRLALDEVRSAGRKHIARVVIDDDQMGEISIEEAIAEKKAALTPASLVSFLKEGSGTNSVSASELKYSFGGTVQQHTKMLTSMVQGGELVKEGKQYRLAEENASTATESILSKITPEKVMDFVTPGKGPLAASNAISIDDALFYLGDDGQEGYSVEQGREVKTPLRKEREALVRQKLDEMVQQGTLKKIGPEAYARPDFGTKPAGENEYFSDSPYRT